MPVEAVLINGPGIDFNTLLSLAYDALGYNIAGVADASHRKMVDAEKFLSCLAAFKDQSAEITSSLLSHVAFSILVITGKRDLLAILDRTSGMPFIHALASPDVDMAVISGTLAQWQAAVVSGTNEAAPPTVRACYSKILLLFDYAGLTSVWNGYDRTTAPDRNGFLLEDRRK